MFGAIGVVVGQTLPAPGALSPGSVFLELALLAGCLLLVAGVVALVDLAAEECRQRVHRRRMTRRVSQA